MKKVNSFPNWFINTLAIIGLWHLLLYTHNNISVIYIFFFILIYPIILMFLSFSDVKRFSEINRWKEGNTKEDGIHFFNIALTIIGFFVLILLLDCNVYIQYTSKILNSRFTILLSNYVTVQKTTKDYSFWALPFYIILLLYFVILSLYFAYKSKEKINGLFNNE